MNDNRINDIFYLQKMEEKIFKFKQIYHPNLIANLSKEAYDVYLIRNSIDDQILEELNKKERSIHKIKEFITSKISEIESKLKDTSESYEINLLKLSIDEWKAFL